MVPCSLIVRTMLALLTLSAENGSMLVLQASGDEARAAVDALARLFESNFSARDPGSDC